MNCLELRYNKGGETKIVKIINQSDTDQLSDWDLLFEFLTTGNLPQNVTVEGTTRYELLQYLLNELENSKQPLRTYMLFDKSGGLQSKQDVINKIIGNKSIKDVLYDTYLDDMFTYNCLYVSGWGAKTWYGFTDQRPLMITGRPRLNQNMTEHTLFTSYYELRQGSQFVTDIVNKLFDKFSDYTSEDIYDKFTWLANNKLKETVDALYIPQYKIGVKNIHSELKKNIQQFVGYGIKYNGDIHIIKKRGNENNIIVTNIETNRDIEIPINSVYNLYEQFTVHYKNKAFYLFNKQWYYKENEKFVKCSEGESNELFNHFFGLNDDKFESINVYNKDLKVTLESKLYPSNITLQESLPVGSYVRTSSGYYIKDVDGTFKKGDEILESNTTIYKVFYPKNDANDENEKIKSLLPIKNSKYVLTQQDALIILSELFKFDSKDVDIWDHVKFSYDSEDIKVRTINDEVILDIGLKDNSKDEINLNKMDSLRLAVALFNNLRSDNPISIPNGMNVLDFWYAIEKYKLGDEVLKHRNKEYVLTSEQIESINLLKEIAGNSDENTNEWEEAVLENREQTMKSIHNENDAEWDTFINELINKGLYIISCKL